MKGSTPILLGTLFLAAAAGLWRLSGETDVAVPAREIGRWAVEEQLGPLVTEGTPLTAETSPTITPEPSPAPVPVETVREAWDEEIRQETVEESPQPLPVTEDAKLELRNDTDYTVDLGALPELPTDLTVSPEEPVVLIVHTHTTECYTDPDGDTGVYRSTDETEGVMAVGDVLQEVLEARGYGVIHDKTLCDYPEYEGAYSRSRELIQRDLEENPSILLVLDLHRDAVGDGNGGQLRLASDIAGEAAAQLMLVVGTDDGGLAHPEWRENLAFAARLGTIVEGMYPGLLRPINLRSERFNQDLGPLSLLAEVGTSGNTQEEANRCGRALGAGIAAVLDEISGKYT